MEKNKKGKFVDWFKTTFTKANIKRWGDYTLKTLGVFYIINSFAMACVQIGVESVKTTTPIATVLRNPKEALTPPTGWEYKYAYNSADEVFDFTKYSNSFHTDIEYSWTADGAYSNYTAVFPVSENASPFPITLTFRHSNTAWQPFRENTYVPVSTNIGSDNTVGTLYKWEMSFVNNTNHDYNVVFDISSSLAQRSFYLYRYNSSGVQVSLNDHAFRSSDLSFNGILIPAFSSIFSKTIYTANSYYFDAFYLNDLGVSTAYTNGYNTGSSEGYTAGYSDGQSNGESVGYSSGYSDGYSVGSSDGFADGYTDGYDDGYLYNETSGGFAQLFFRISDGMASLFEVEILPGITLAGIVLFPVVLGLLFLAVKIFKKGE